MHVSSLSGALLTAADEVNGQHLYGLAAARVYTGLRARIVSLELLPDTVLSRAEIAKQYGVSQSPVREAVQKLEQEGLVVSYPKSRTLGQLVYHIAGVPQGIAAMLEPDESSPPDVPPVEASSRDEVLRLHDESIEAAVAALQRWGEERLSGRWRMMVGGNPVIDMPRIAMVYH